MPSASLLTGAGVIAAAAIIAYVMAPILAADMRRAVERQDRAPTDMTAVALMLLGGALLTGLPLSAGLLWATWA